MFVCLLIWHHEEKAGNMWGHYSKNALTAEGEASAIILINTGVVIFLCFVYLSIEGRLRNKTKQRKIFFSIEKKMLFGKDKKNLFLCSQEYLKKLIISLAAISHFCAYSFLSPKQPFVPITYSPHCSWPGLSSPCYLLLLASFSSCSFSLQGTGIHLNSPLPLNTRSYADTFAAVIFLQWLLLQTYTLKYSL